MRVAYITGRYPGISHTFITREVRALRALGCEVDTFSVWRTADDLLLSAIDRDERDATYALLPLRPRRVLGAHLAALRASPRAYAAMARRSLGLRRSGLRGLALAAAWIVEAGLLWHECRRRGIRHIHAHLNGTAPVLALLAAQLGGDAEPGGPRWRWSMTVHGPSEFFDAYEERLGEKVRAASMVVCISDFARSQLMSMVESEHWPKLQVVHCGVDPEVFTPSSEADDDEMVRILNVGRLTSIKGQVVLIEALARLRRDGLDARLTLVGDGPARAEVERAVARHGLDGCVELHGAAGEVEVRALYEAAAIVCVSSFAEGIPVVLMEAMAMELPVVAPAIMGIPELVESGVNGLLVRPGRVDELAEAIATLARSQELRARLGRAARRTVVEEFDIRRSAEQLARLFGRLDEVEVAPDALVVG